MKSQFPNNKLQINSPPEARLAKGGNFQISNLWVLFVVWVLLFGFSGASAQQAPELMVTWKANNYAPPDYQGKVLPIGNTTIDMALEVIDGGKVAGLSRNEIRWLVNNELVDSGRGVKNISFPADQFKGNQIVDVIIPSYRGAALNKRVIIPLVRPEAAIGGNLDEIKALPYFFNVSSVSDLKFTWAANNVSSENTGSNLLTLEVGNAAPGSEISLKVEVQSLSNLLEIAAETINFIIR